MSLVYRKRCTRCCTTYEGDQALAAFSPGRTVCTPCLQNQRDRAKTANRQAIARRDADNRQRRKRTSANLSTQLQFELEGQP